jgi:hypothetical protein
MADAIEFVSGLHIKAPHEKAPSFVKASISIKVADLGLWLREKHKAGEEWVNADIKVSKGNKWYVQVSTFKPKDKDEAEPSKPAEPQKPKDNFADMTDDIPF